MKKKPFLTLRETVLFGLIPAIMMGTQLAMSALPNIHLTGVLTVVLTRLFRTKALIPVYVYVLLMGLYLGFSLWWIPNLYVWTVLWAMAMLIPKKIPDRWAIFVFPIVCSLHGFSYGSLWALSQPLLTGIPWDGLPEYIAAGIPFDIYHGIGNLCLGTVILPLCRAITKLNEYEFSKKRK